MFRGNNPAKVDDKGRLKIPSGFKALLDAKSVTEVYITSTDGKFAEIWPLQEWEKREKLLAEHSNLDVAVAKYLSLTSYWGHQVEIDSQGRVLLPQRLRERAKLLAEVEVLGQLVYLEVHNGSEFEERLTNLALTADDLRSVAEKIRQHG